MKIFAGYAFEILNQNIINSKVALKDDTFSLLDNYMVKILDGTAIKVIEDKIDSYKILVWENYF